MANKPLHKVEHWIIEKPQLASVMRFPRAKTRVVSNKWKALNAKAAKPTKVNFLQTCEATLLRVYNGNRFERTVNALESRAARCNPGYSINLHANRALLARHGHVGYLNAVRHRFYREMEERLDSELKRVEKPGAILQGSPHERLIREVLTDLRHNK